MRAILNTVLFGSIILIMGMSTMKMNVTKTNTVRDRLAEEYPDVDLLFMTEEEYDEAIIGVSEMCQGTNNHHHVVYDWDKVVDINMGMGMSEEEALEFFEFNQGDAYVGEHTPIYIRTRLNIIGE